MIQCVQPEGEQEYCSRICCTNSIKNAIRLKMLNPGCQVVILYKDIITYGFREMYYSEARRRGVLFVRYTANDRPEVSLEGAGQSTDLVVRVSEHVFGRAIRFTPDVLALSTSIVPAEGAQELARALRVPLSGEGFFLEAHLKMRPMEFPDEGMYLAGMAHYPKFIEECITHAQAAAGRAITFLSRAEIQVGGNVATVDAAKCTACLTCVRTCPFGVPEVRSDKVGVGQIRGAAWIDPGRCQGCGTCTAECPARAIQLAEYHDAQLCFGTGSWGVAPAFAEPAYK
jgi:heterodisulfide reductase subunit A-like polyferredoxin